MKNFSRLTEDKPKAVITALATLLVFVVAGWGITTWLSLRPPAAAPVRSERDTSRQNDLSFLQAKATSDFAVRGNNPFYAPYIAARTSPQAPRVIRTPTKGNTPNTTPTPPPVYKNIDLVFKGTMKNTNGKFLALIHDTSSGVARFMNIGDTVQGGKVVEFTNSTLVLERSGQKIELKLAQPLTVDRVRVQ